LQKSGFVIGKDCTSLYNICINVNDSLSLSLYWNPFGFLWQQRGGEFFFWFASWQNKPQACHEIIASTLGRILLAMQCKIETHKISGHNEHEQQQQQQRIRLL
jgi:hypothetical protein